MSCCWFFGSFACELYFGLVSPRGNQRMSMGLPFPYIFPGPHCLHSGSLDDRNPRVWGGFVYCFGRCHDLLEKVHLKITEKQLLVLNVLVPLVSYQAWAWIRGLSKSPRWQEKYRAHCSISFPDVASRRHICNVCSSSVRGVGTGVEIIWVGNIDFTNGRFQIRNFLSWHQLVLQL